MSGCAVQGCDGLVAAVGEFAVAPAGNGPVRMCDLPLCAGHLHEFESSELHAGAYFAGNGFARFRRAVVVEPQLIVDGDPVPQKPRRWPTYQELVASLARGGRPG